MHPGYNDISKRLRKFPLLDGTKAILQLITLFLLADLSAKAAGVNPLPARVVKGVFGDALDATGDLAVHSAKVLPVYSSTPLTVELWCRLNSSADFNILISSQQKESGSHWEVYTEKGAGTLSAYFPGLLPQIIRSPVKLVDGKWHYIAMVVEERNVKLFADGKEAVSEAVVKGPPQAVYPGPLCVGGAMIGQGNLVCDGAIDEVRISTAIREINAIPSSPFMADAQTVGLWHFDLSPDRRGFPDASSSNNPLLCPYASLNDKDRASFNAGPSPLDSEAKTISLSKGACEIPASPPAFSLDGDWQMVQGGSQDQRLSGTWPDAIKAPVPGSVHTALYKSGIIPFPFLGRNQLTTRPWSFKTYYLKKVFPRPPQGKDETLVFDGICNRCEIWLNGRDLGSHEGMFTNIRFPVADLLKDENTLIVRLDPSAQDWASTVVFNNSFGWHYSMFPPLGIWRSVTITGQPAIQMQAPFVATRDARAGSMDFETTLTGTDGGWSGTLVGNISPDNFKGAAYNFEQRVDSTSPSKELHLQFSIPDPKLWWPVDMGAPNLYKLHLAFLPRHGGRADVRDITFGIRTVQTASINGKTKPALYNWTFVINGQPTFVKGAGWCTPDAMMDFSRARYEHFLAMAAREHIQMVRAWGSGMVETNDFYDLCDHYGIMVLQEWPTAWNSHDKQPYGLLESAVREGTLRLRSHPSLVMYGGGNESSKPYGPAIDMMGRLSIELDGTRDFHRGEPFGGSDHDYNIYWGNGSFDHAFVMTSIFYGEFGIASFPCYESVQRFLPDPEKNAWPPAPDGSFAFHTPKFNTAEDLSRITRMSQLFTTGSTMRQFIIGSELAQAVGVREPLERARTRWPEATGALFYKLNDNCPAASWSTVDWFGAPKISYYLIRDSFSPLLAVGLYERGVTLGEPLSIPMYLLDDADQLKGSSWEVSVRAYGAGLKQIKEARFGGRGSIAKVKSLGNFTLDESQTKTTPLLVVLDVLKDGALVQRNYNFTNFEPKKDCLFDLPRTSVTIRTEGGRAVVKNTGSLPGVGVNIARPGHMDTFEPEDNFFWLEPGESKSVAVNNSDGLVVRGWNVDSATP